MTLQRIVSGGQTGVDRAALDAALQLGLAVGGWCPLGRLAEDGSIDARYPLRETPKANYAQRTRWNVRDSDGTLVLHRGRMGGGTGLTTRSADDLSRPCRTVDLSRSVNPREVAAWIAQCRIVSLNVAGPRESEEPGIYQAALAFLLQVLHRMRSAR